MGSKAGQDWRHLRVLPRTGLQASCCESLFSPAKAVGSPSCCAGVGSEVDFVVPYVAAVMLERV